MVYAFAPTMDDLGGLDSLLATLEQAGSEGMTLTSENVGAILTAAKEHEVPFELAWSRAINRVQASQAGGVVNVTLERTLREDRAMLEESRPFYQAAYEGRDITSRERAQAVASAWRRLPDLIERRRARAA